MWGYCYGCLAWNTHWHTHTRTRTYPQIHKRTTGGIHGKHMCQSLLETQHARNHSARGPSSSTCVCVCVCRRIISPWGSHHPPGPLTPPNLTTLNTAASIFLPPWHLWDLPPLPPFNYSAAAQLRAGIRAIDSRRNARQLGWKWRN